ncbi:MAG: anti-phage defense-associated sirtuin Dsr1 [Gammaproteobacteria bacterium]|nr:anti-phage defense-associated sirtuin Dsr1 [Gammaproteobacteria bacterium]
MQFIKNGPDIPERLLQAHEDGRVVFFCGAGISQAAGLPGFSGLVDKLYASLGVQPSPIAKAAIKRGQYDTAIGLMENEIAGGRYEVRGQLADILTPPTSMSDATSVHEAILTLGRNRGGALRVITTNFDPLFTRAAEALDFQFDTFEAPLLPVPKNRWSGLVYLHGLLPNPLTDHGLDRLVVSSGDFGLAYLTERWAARFVSELFRNYVVCFVGYSINDPVMRYMMDALAADRYLGESSPEAFAFGSYSNNQRENACAEWDSKNVTPILYREHRKHHYLRKTLALWAEVYRDGVFGKERIIAENAIARPFASTQQDDFIGRVRWALSDLSGGPAKKFAELVPTPTIDWLDPIADPVFDHHDLVRFRVHPDAVEDKTLAFSLLSRPAHYSQTPRMALLRQEPTSVRWDAVMFQLARWLALHLDQPRLILWIADQGGDLDPALARMLDREIDSLPSSAPLLPLWRLLLAGRVHGRSRYVDTFAWQHRFGADGPTRTLMAQLREMLTPRLFLKKPFRLPIGVIDDEGDERKNPDHLKEIVDWEVVLSADDVRTMLNGIKGSVRWNDALRAFLPDATLLLRDALDLMREVGDATEERDGSFIDQPSISEHQQNQEFHDWTLLIELVRDAWLETLKCDKDAALREVDRWSQIEYPVFRRLIFFAATKFEIFRPHQSLAWLLSDDHRWFWSTETERETLRLLVALGEQELSDKDRESLQAAILIGPPRAMFREDIDDETFKRVSEREIWLRLAKFGMNGAKLNDKAASRFKALSKKHPTWVLEEDERDEFSVWMGSGEDFGEFQATPTDRRELTKWLIEHPENDAWRTHDWRDRCRKDFPRVASALIVLAQQDRWMTTRWREAFQVWGDEALARRSWRRLGRVLMDAPDEVLLSFGHSLTWWVRAVATVVHEDESISYFLVRLLNVYRGRAIERDDRDDFISKAINHPVGHITEAALTLWQREKLDDDQGLVAPIAQIFSVVTDPEVEIFRHGRVILASRLIVLFRVDRAWTREHLMPLFDWRRSEVEACAAWQGFLWSPRLYRPLMEILKTNFLETADHYESLGRRRGQYATFLTYASLEPGEIFSKAELARATAALPLGGRIAVSQALVNALDAAGDQKAEYWRNRILPYLSYVWPKSVDALSPETSRSFSRLGLVAGDSFPEVLRTVRRWLVRSDQGGFVVHLLCQSGLAGKFGREALELLDAVVSDNAVMQPRDLREVLEKILVANPDLEWDPRMQRLWAILRRIE